MVLWYSYILVGAYNLHHIFVVAVLLFYLNKSIIIWITIFLLALVSYVHIFVYLFETTIARPGIWPVSKFVPLLALTCFKFINSFMMPWSHCFGCNVVVENNDNSLWLQFIVQKSKPRVRPGTCHWGLSEPTNRILFAHTVLALKY